LNDFYDVNNKFDEDLLEKNNQKFLDRAMNEIKVENDDLLNKPVKEKSKYDDRIKNNAINSNDENENED